MSFPKITHLLSIMSSSSEYQQRKIILHILHWVMHIKRSSKQIIQWKIKILYFKTTNSTFKMSRFMSVRFDYISAGEAFGGCSSSSPCGNINLECIEDSASPLFGTCVIKSNNMQIIGNNAYGTQIATMASSCRSTLTNACNLLKLNLNWK